METFYDILGVPPTASLKEINSAYKKQALRCHPDRQQPTEQALATESFQKLAEAYATLKDESLRNRYDISLTSSKRQHHLSTSTGPTGTAPSGPGGTSGTGPRGGEGFRRSPSSSPPDRTYAPPSPPSPHAPMSTPPRPPVHSRPYRSSTIANPSNPTSRRSSHTHTHTQAQGFGLDAFAVFYQAWGKGLKEIEGEIDRRAWASEYAPRSTWRTYPSERESSAFHRSTSSAQGYRPSRGGGGEATGPGAGMGTGTRERRDSRAAAMDSFLRTRQELGRRRSQSASLGSGPPGVGGGGGGGGGEPVKEIHQTVVTIERSASGVHMKREIKSRTLTEDGMLHDRYRRTRAGIEYDDPQPPQQTTAPKLSQPHPRRGYPTRREEHDAEAPYRRPSSASVYDPGYIPQHQQTHSHSHPHSQYHHQQTPSTTTDYRSRPGFVRSPSSTASVPVSAASTAPTTPWSPVSSHQKRARTPIPLAAAAAGGRGQYSVSAGNLGSSSGDRGGGMGMMGGGERGGGGGGGVPARQRTRSMGGGPRPMSFHGGSASIYL